MSTRKIRGSPVSPIDTSKEAYRDVLVIAFTKVAA